MNPNIILYSTSKARVCFVNVPDGTVCNSTEQVGQKKFAVYHYPFGEKNTHWKQCNVELPPGEWQLLSRLSQVSEEQAADLLEEYECVLSGYEGPFHSGYRIYTTELNLTKSPKEALHSLARSLNIPEDQDPVVLVEFKK